MKMKLGTRSRCLDIIDLLIKEANHDNNFLRGQLLQEVETSLSEYDWRENYPEEEPKEKKR
jgi:hypothetical protein